MGGEGGRGVDVGEAEGRGGAGAHVGGGGGAHEALAGALQPRCGRG